jgi:NMD protein affecting ribosome stability and mRNA decay
MKNINKEALRANMLCSHCGEWANPNYIPLHIKLCDKCYKKLNEE